MQQSELACNPWILHQILSVTTDVCLKAKAPRSAVYSSICAILVRKNDSIAVRIFAGRYNMRYVAGIFCDSRPKTTYFHASLIYILCLSLRFGCPHVVLSTTRRPSAPLGPQEIYRRSGDGTGSPKAVSIQSNAIPFIQQPSEATQ